MLYQKLQHHFHHPNYFFFMVSLLLLILIPPFATTLENGGFLLNIVYGLVLLSSASITASNLKEFIYYLVLGLSIYILFLFGERSPSGLNLLNTILTFFFFALVLRRLVFYILRSKEIDANDVFACVSGYLVLGIVAAPMFALIEQTFPGAFHMPDRAGFYDFIYFSYITVTTVGFGDISPIHPFAKSFTVLLCIVGQLYLTILVAIIIGKFLASGGKKK